MLKFLPYFIFLAALKTCEIKDAHSNRSKTIMGACIIKKNYSHPKYKTWETACCKESEYDCYRRQKETTKGELITQVRVVEFRKSENCKNFKTDTNFGRRLWW